MKLQCNCVRGHKKTHVDWLAAGLNYISKLNLQKQFQDFQYKPAILEYWVYERMDTEIYRGHLQFMCKCHTHSRRLIKEAAEVKG